MKRVADVYTDERAAATYWRCQQAIGQLGGELNLWKFVDHVGSADTVLDFGCGDADLLERPPSAVKISVEPNPHARKAAAERGALESTRARRA
jgi:hypothetical protein